MENEKFLKTLRAQLEGEYLTSKEIQYGNKAGLFLSPYEYKKFLEYKESIASPSGEVSLLPLKPFNSGCLYYCLGNDLKGLVDDLCQYGALFADTEERFSQTFLESRIYSEIEGSLNVEAVPTTRKRLRELLEKDAPVENQNDVIIKNMKRAIDFVSSMPSFNKDNLFTLYSLLSEGCLDEEDKLRPGEAYRYDEVEIDHDLGCPHEMISECMDTLFSFVDKTLNEKGNPYERILLPHICHYYLIYIHPYFDYNGRTARMVSYWIYLLNGRDSLFPLVSEAINQTKGKYYHAIEETRRTHNDLTYFLKYLCLVSLDYLLCYQNIDSIERSLRKVGIILTEAESNYIRRILISYDGPFDYVSFLNMANVSMSKQGALKTLNHLLSYGFLKEKETKGRGKLFEINDELIAYATRTFGYKSPKS